ncbi:hypothetical protein [Pontibacillus yanchengensis]|uniref:Uncharacterized protein n=1 Tax=Pontibacillus yanchengensis Y32 TaxID=1385514 RepID=A0A0A2TJ08_9BACI|nr:hypothetical protein [Pontibacillus yanchengensis]KGP74398.1 hypothetical protein N782_15400 [Pontibacillus yanchengensis Y32]
MGYILPIAHHQYNDYRERVESPKRDPFHVDPVFRLDLEENLRENEPRDEDRKEFQDYEERMEKQQFTKKTNQIYTPNTTHAGKGQKIYSELTGIGRHFNESV